MPLRGRALDLDALLAGAVPRTKLIYLANPNNPTGTLLDRGECAASSPSCPRACSACSTRPTPSTPTPSRRARRCCARARAAVRAAHVLEGLRAGRAARSATRSPRPRWPTRSTACGRSSTSTSPPRRRPRVAPREDAVARAWSTLAARGRSVRAARRAGPRPGALADELRLRGCARRRRRGLARRLLEEEGIIVRELPGSARPAHPRDRRHRRGERAFAAALGAGGAEPSPAAPGRTPG